MPKAIEITEENLEDLLAYDDLFLDYFNTFLALPVFPQPLYYNRLTGLFEEVTPVQGGISGKDGDEAYTPPPYGATDEEREEMLQWAKEERLPLFLRTQLFLELKLCKLLLRPLDDRYSATRRSSHQTIRGYSRQTETYASSLSNSADNSANEATDLDDEASVWGLDQRAMLFKYQRPGSRAISLPPRLQFQTSMSGNSSKQQRVNGNGWRQGSGGAGRVRHKQLQQNGAIVSALRNVGQQGATPAGPSRDVTFDDRTETFGMEYEKVPEVVQGKSSPSCNARSSRRASQVTDGDGVRVTSAPVNGEEFSRVPTCSDFDAMFGEEEPDVNGENFVAFADDIVSESQTETDVRNLEGKHKMTLQEMKEQILGCVGGQEAFQRFLAGTTGEHLYCFWLDCEYFKDTIEDYDEEEINTHRNRLFRDIQDKYKLDLTHDAKKQILAASSSAPVSHTIFIRTQYDVLRRLRAYWLPRFLMHKERLNELRVQLRPAKIPMDFNMPERPITTSFFPSISLVNSMPVNPEDLLQIAMTTSWDMVSKGGRKLDDRIKSAKLKMFTKPPQQSVREKLIQALTVDKPAGGPFKNCLIKHQDAVLLSNLLFWEDVTEYGQAEDRSSDRLLRMSHAWKIFNTYMAVACKHPIGVVPSEQDRLHSLLLTARDFVDSAVFNSAKLHSVETLEKPWIRYLKEDAKKYYDCRVRNAASPVSTAEDFEVMLDDNQNLIVRRPRPWVRRYPPSTCSERGERLRTALSLAESIDDARRIEQRRRAKERRKITERERRKAIRNARQRQRDAKRKVSFKPKPEGEGGEGGEAGPKVEEAAPEEEAQETEKAPDFISSVSNKGVISLFKKYLTENEGRDLINIVSLYLDIEAYHTIVGSDKGSKAKKDSHASFINKPGKDKGKISKPTRGTIHVNFVDLKNKKDLQASHILKTYLDQGARKRVFMNERVYSKLKAEKDRPKSPTLKEAQAHILPQLEEAFKKFWESQAEELGIDGKSLANMSKAELALRADNDPSLLTGWKKKGKGQGKADGRVQPTKEDRMEFLVALTAASSGHFPLQMLYFYKYLTRHGREDGFPLIDKDLFFYCEVQKFKDASHQFADEELLRRKVQAIIECYLDSSTQPTLQVDIPTDVQLKTTRAAQRYLSGKDINPGLFDEAQYVVFKDLLPYWAGFMHNVKSPEQEQKRPLTKQERERKKRLEEFINWKPPSAKTFTLPSLPKGTSVAAMTFSLTDGVKWREGPGDDDRTFGTTPDTAGKRFGGFDHRRNSILSNVDSVTESQQSSVYA